MMIVMPLTFSKQTFSQQLAEQLEELIRSGKWQAGEQTPPIRKVAEKYIVSARTAHLALRDLQEKGLLVRQPSGRTVVSENIEEIETCATEADTQSEGSVVPVQQIAMLGARQYQSIPDNWAGQIFLGAEASLIETGQYCATRIHSLDHEPDKRLKRVAGHLDHLAGHLSGAIIFQDLPGVMEALMKQLDQLGLPWITINRARSDVMYNFVSADNQAVGRAAGRLLMLEKRAPIWVLGLDITHHGGVVSHTAKVTGLYEAYIQAGQQFPDIKYLPCADAGFKHALKKTQRELKKGQKPSAIYATDDFLALGAMQACREAGLRIPEDVWVIGTTGMEAAKLNTPSLTVIPQPMKEMGKVAGDMLIRMIQTGEKRLLGKKIKTKIALRGSTAVSKATQKMLGEENLVETLS